MQAMHMITVAGVYNTLVGGCTVRKWEGKYGGLQVGDNVIMNHTEDPTTKDIKGMQATEFLRVRAIAIADLESLLENHGYDDDITSAAIYEFYPLAEGEERNLDDLYCAIYFF